MRPGSVTEMRLEGFEPPTNGLEGRRSSSELQAPAHRVALLGGQYSSACGRSSVISNQGALEPTKMCSEGRMLGSSCSVPIATCTRSPSRTTENSSEPHVPQRV